MLVKHITWRHNEIYEDKTTAFGEYPCAEALVVMGLNCVPEVIDSLARGEPDIVNELMVSLRASVLIEVYSRAYGDADGPKEAIALIERDLERSSHYTRAMYYHRRNVERLLKELRDRSDHPERKGDESN